MNKLHPERRTAKKQKESKKQRDALQDDDLKIKKRVV
jgi:hypothetical protein